MLSNDSMASQPHAMQREPRELHYSRYR
jgi:hypothetical protein